MSSSMTWTDTLSGLRWFTVYRVRTHKLGEEGNSATFWRSSPAGQEPRALSPLCWVFPCCQSHPIPQNVHKSGLYTFILQKDQVVLWVWNKLQGESFISFVSGPYLVCHITCGLYAMWDASFRFIGMQSTVHTPNSAKIADAHSDVSQK